MFLTYLPIACVYFVVMGAGPFMLAADASSDVSTSLLSLTKSIQERLSFSIDLAIKYLGSPPYDGYVEQLAVLDGPIAGRILRSVGCGYWRRSRRHGRLALVPRKSSSSTQF